MHDDLNRECLAIEIDTLLAAPRLIQAFGQLKAKRGLSDVLHVDNGPAFLGETFTEWVRVDCVLIRYIQPVRSNLNAYIECFNRTYRDGFLDLVTARVQRAAA